MQNIFRPDRFGYQSRLPAGFMVALRDILVSMTPQSFRKLPRLLGVNKQAIWRWRMLFFSFIEKAPGKAHTGIIEAEETYQRESRKRSSEWIRHFFDPDNVSAPPRFSGRKR